MNTSEILRGWTTILAGRAPFLSIEITRECPLSCPGCYAYGDNHLGGEVVLKQVSDFKGDELVRRVIEDRRIVTNRCISSIVGGEPLVRFRELHGKSCPGSAPEAFISNSSPVRSGRFRPSGRKIPLLTVVVSIDGLAPEHDVRRKPATYERILNNISGCIRSRCIARSRGR